MVAELDQELEQAARQAFARMIGAIPAPVPDELPDPRTTPVTPVTALRYDDEPGGWAQEHRRTRRRLVAATAGVAAAAAALAAAVILPDGGGGRVETETPPAGEDTTTTDDPTSSTTRPTTTTTTTTTTTSPTGTTGTGTGTGTGAGIAPTEVPDYDSIPMGQALTSFVPSGEVRRAELRAPLADQEGLDVPLDRLELVTSVVAGRGSPEIWAADDGEEIAIEIRAEWLTGYGSGIEGTPRQLQSHWMVSAVDNQFVVWGVVADDIETVSVYLTDDGVESVPTTAIGPPELQSRVFAVILPPLAYIENVAGERADGSVFLSGAHLEESLQQFTMHHPNRQEWTGFIPVVVH
jgi:hypothetical protein